MVKPPNEEGFSFVEAISAFAIMTILAVALTHTGTGRSQALASSFHETVALRIAQAKLEEARAQRAPLTVGAKAFELPEGVGPLPAGRGQQTVVAVQPRLFDVTIQVWWQPVGSQQAASVQLTTRIAGKQGK
ncbi:MAG: hypothetical protein AB8H80_09390 [Planctomycetota bacterium]